MRTMDNKSYKEFLKNSKSCLIDKKKQMKFAKERKKKIQKDYDGFMKNYIQQMAFVDHVIEDTSDQIVGLKKLIIKYEDKPK